jgi:hypothetical protein
MNLDNLILAAEEISEVAFTLHQTPHEDDQIVGYWGGERSDVPNGISASASAFEDFFHVCTVRDVVLHQVGTKRHIHTLGLFKYIYTDDSLDDYHQIRNEKLDWEQLQCTGTPLFKKAVKSFPPFMALCLYGGAVIDNWFLELGLKRYQYSELYHRKEFVARIASYDQVWHERTCGIEENAAMIVGGWHKFWADDDYYIPKEANFVFQTFKDAEPWYECFGAGSNFFVKSRIT